MGYIIMMDGMAFQFDSTDEYSQFLKMLFRYASDRRLLYICLIDSVQHLMGSIIGSDEPDINIASIERALSVLYNDYGKIYDPDGEYMSISY
jgi:hypothetical protein